MRIDWGVGRYETTAAQLDPVAAALVQRAGVARGDRVVDVGCGTGNAALYAAERGALVTGVDPAERLLEVARERAVKRGVHATFVRGDAASIPLPSESADIVLSVFGVIFAPDPVAAVAEMVRVSASAGRILLTAWLPEGAISDCAGVFQRAVAEAIGLPPGPPPFAWHDRSALEGAFRQHGLSVAIEQDEVALTAASAREYLDIQRRDHPISIAGGTVLQSRGPGEGLERRALDILEAANEDPRAFRVTSRYVVARAEHV